MDKLLDPAILVTQILGFLSVFWVLRRVAWGPILNALEARRSKIANDVASAERLRKEAEEIKSRYEEEIKTIEAQARERIQLAVSEGQKVAEEIRAEAREEAQRLREKTKVDIRMEYDKARAELHDEIVSLALGAAEKLVEEQMDEDRHRKLVDRFLSEVPGLKSS